MSWNFLSEIFGASHYCVSYRSVWIGGYIFKEKTMKRLFVLFVILISLTAFITVSCEGKQEAADSGRVKLIIGASPRPHAEILEFVKPKLAEQGIDLELVVQSDNVLTMRQTDAGEFDANYIAHWPGLKASADEMGFNFGNVGAVHIEPIGFYSERYTSKEELPAGAVIGIPNDFSSEYRGLKILEENGFLKLTPDASPATGSLLNVQEYLKPIKLVEVEAGMIARSRDEYDGYILNTSFILDAGIDPATNLFREGLSSQFGNIICVNAGRENEAAFKALYAALTTEEVRQFILTEYKGAVVPAF
jgi:D-methionine transport system substrate-binding protein